ncbi:MAG: nucleotidyltransferase domain-containing protein [Pseudolabrys sp.]|nr:nucleotidyltransferase domain-containing protein [Pseudolabrys sp.]
MGTVILKLGMSMADSQSGGLASALFSKVQLHVLALFFSQPSQSYQLTQVIRHVGSGRGAVQREVEKLTAAGILTLAVGDGRKLYRANRQSPIFEELHGLIVKTVGLIEPLRKALKPLMSKIDVAFVYGSVAKGEDTANSDIDMMVIGDEVAYTDVYKLLQKAEQTLMRPVNPTLMSRAEWMQKISDKNPFVAKIACQPKVFIVGAADELNGIEQSG